MSVQVVADRIMALFVATKSRPNHALDERQLRFNVYNKLNPKELTEVDQAIDSLTAQGFITTDTRMGMFCLILTEQGYDHIYPLNPQEATDRISLSILAVFARQHARPNHALDYKTLRFGIFDKLPPKEHDLAPAAIEQLITQGLVTEEDRYGKCLVLTEKGYNGLYE
jgi:hypothetical protein